MYGQTYAIILVDDLGISEEKYGDVNFYLLRIRIDRRSTVSVQWATLCHEVLHITDAHLNLELTEGEIHRIDSGVFQFLSQVMGCEK